MPIYSKELWICATAYIRADNEQQAEEKLRTLHLATLEVAEQDGGVCVSGAPYDDPELPELSLSPAMSVYADNGYYTDGADNPTHQLPELAYDDSESEE
jgi:hypothetical protein